MRSEQELLELADRLATPTADELAPDSVRFPVPTRQGLVDGPNSPLLERCRVVAGRLGSGKSTLLQVIRQGAEHASTSAVPRAAPPPDSSTLREIADSIAEGAAPDGTAGSWRNVWRATLLCFALTSYRHDPRYGQGRASALDSLVDERFSWLGSLTRETRALHPYRILKSLLSVLRESVLPLNDSFWDDLEAHLHDAMTGQPPVVVCLDHLDEDADNAPSLHYSAQAGLVAEILRQEGRPIGQVLRVVVAVQHTVLRRLPPHLLAAARSVLELAWDTETLQDHVAGQLYAAPGAKFGELLSASLGVGHVTSNSRARPTEEVVAYVFRNTAGSPRDVGAVLREVLLGAARHAPAGNEAVAKVVRDRVRDGSNAIGEHLLYHATTSCMALTQNGAEDTSGTVTRPFQRRILDFLAAVGAEVAERRRYEELAYVTFDRPIDQLVLSELWAGRLLGRASVPEPGRPYDCDIAYEGHSTDSGLRRSDVQSVGLSSCLLGVLPSLTLVPSAPRVEFI